MYGSLIIAYLFLGGAAAGALFVVSAWSLRLRCRSTAYPQSKGFMGAFATLSRRAYLAGLVLLVLAMLCLLGDLGSPGRALLVLVRPRPTVLTVGAYTLVIEALVAAALAALRLLGSSILRSRACAALEILCCVGAVAALSYTGVFLFDSSVALWNSWTLIGLFALSSLSAGISLVLLVDWLAQGRTELLCAAKPLQKWHLLCLALESILLALFVCAAFSNHRAQASVGLLLDPEMLATALIGVGGFGIVVPACLEAYSLARKNCRSIPASDVACLLGCLVLRYIVIVCGVI